MLADRGCEWNRKQAISVVNGASAGTLPFGRGAPPCAPPDPELRSPRAALPKGTCDCHAHICGPASKFPYVPDRIYTPPDALVPDYAALLSALGTERAVLVQPSIYGNDNTAMLAALRQLCDKGIACRAIAVVDPQIEDRELRNLDAAGVRGIRFNLVDLADPGAGPPLETMRGLAKRISGLGWHTEFLVHIDDHPEFDRTFSDWPTPIVIGHMGYCRAGATIEAPGFQAMLRLAEAGRCWIKLTGPYRIADGDLCYGRASTFARALVEAVPEQLVWGTDWPHVMVTRAMPNDADLADLLLDWIPDPAIRRAVTADNPLRLYGFNDEQSRSDSK